MGDRGNIIMKYEDGTEIAFYTHWTGYITANVVRDALSRRERWNDASYLARMVFCELVEGSEKDSTGFGISPQVAGDVEHVVPVLDVREQVVHIVANAADDAAKKTIATYTFLAFSNLTDAECEAIGAMRRDGTRR